MSAIELKTHTADETRAIGTALGRLLRGGELVALDGPLGAGKTQFTKGLALGLGVAPEEPVVSPTFVLVREYAGRLRLIHVDAYRLRSAADLHELGFEEFRAPGAVVVVEWAERVSSGLSPNVHVELAYTDDSDTPNNAGRPTDTLRILRVEVTNPTVEREFRQALRTAIPD